MKSPRKLEVEITIFVFLFLVGILYFFSPGITGNVIYDDRESIQEELMTATRGEFFESFGVGTSMCVIISDEDERLSFNVDKTSTHFEVAEHELFSCDGETKEDLILHFPSYSQFSSQEFTCNDLKESSDGDGFYFLPSRFIDFASIQCNEEFQKKFCPALTQCMSEEELAIGFSCCTETAIEEESPGTFSIGGYLIYIVIGSIILVALVGGAAFVMTREKHDEGNPLLSYVEQVMGQGYSEYQVRMGLLQNGYNQADVDKVFAEWRSKNLQSMQRFEKV